MLSKIGRVQCSVMLYLIGRVPTFGFSASSGATTFIAGCLLCDTYLFSRELLKEVTYYPCVHHVVLGLSVNDFFLLAGTAGWVANDVMSYQTLQKPHAAM